MDAMERERLTKALQSAQLLFADLREAHAKTKDTALERTLLELMDKAEPIALTLHRLADAKTP